MSKKNRILIVEDNEHVRNTLYSWLSLSFSNCDVICVTSGEEALASAAEARPDIVLMDIGLPGISGLQAMRRIKILDSDIAVIIISIHETPEYKADAELGGALAFIPKHRMYIELHPLIRETLTKLANPSATPTTM